MSDDGGRAETIDDLSVNQLRALAAILCGRDTTSAADAAGVCRQAVSKWINRPGPFRDALRRERVALRVRLRDGLIAGGLEAVARCRELLSSDEPAIILKASGLLLSAVVGAGRGGADVAEVEAAGEEGPGSEVAALLSAEERAAVIRAIRAAGRERPAVVALPVPREES